MVNAEPIENTKKTEVITPSVGITPASSQETVERSIKRKEYIDSLTEYGSAEYLAKAFKGFGSITFKELQTVDFWLNWLNTKVDRSGRKWID